MEHDLNQGGHGGPPLQYVPSSLSKLWVLTPSSCSSGLKMLLVSPFLIDIAAELTTPWLVTEYLVSQLKVVQQTTCTSQQAFHQLRKQLLPLTAVQRGEFRPGTKLAHVFPVDRRKQTWAIARSQPSVSKLPDLVRPRWLVSLLTLVTIVTAVLVFNQFRAKSASGDIAILAYILVLVFVIAYGSGANQHGPKGLNSAAKYRQPVVTLMITW